MRNAFGLILIGVAIAACAELTLSWAELKGEGPLAAPAIVTTGPTFARVWRAEAAPAVRAALAENVYGVMPTTSTSTILSYRLLDEFAFGGAGVLEEYEIEASVRFGREMLSAAPFRVNLVRPAGLEGPVPVILMETFCSRYDTFPHPEVTRFGASCGGGFLSALMKYVFGRYIATPPVESILARGYAIAAIYPGETIPDSSRDGAAALETLAAGHADASTRWGAIAGWAWMYSRALDVLVADETLGPFIVWGHSRYAKAALLAAATDERIAGVIAHQSGTGGASLNRHKKGESVAAITRAYPHWFAPAYAAYAGREHDMPIDQPHLLALIAPRPVLLGNARRDVWSDPNGAFRAAKGASGVYEALGVAGLTVDRLDHFDPAAGIAFWMRAGGHGVTKEDWPAFLEFLDIHFGFGKPADAQDPSAA
jgi:hypothetical protein